MTSSGPAPQQRWIDTYNAAKAAGRIPGIPPSVLVNGLPTYPAGTSPASACSWTLTHCFGKFDVVDAPTGITGLTFDVSQPLFQLLRGAVTSAGFEWSC